MRWDRNNVRPGMFVTSTDGEKIGKVIRCGAETFVVEKGVLFPKDYELRYDHITDIAGGTIRYALSDFLRGRNLEEVTAKTETPAAAAAATMAATSAPATSAPAARAVTAAAETPRSADRDEIRIPLRREEIGIEKVARESGHVRIHKTVRTEEKHFSVPVKREDVVIEHVAAGGKAPLTGDVPFEEETVDVPLYEEDVRVSKRPYLEEELVVRTVARSVDREGSALLRHEEAEVEDTRKAAGSRDRDETADYEYRDDPDVRR